MKTRIGIGLDYDSCGDVLFEELPSYRLTTFQTSCQKLKAGLNAVLDRIAVTAYCSLAPSDQKEKEDAIILYSGSLRQSKIGDEINENRNHNGSLLMNYPKLCRDKNTLHQWKFSQIFTPDDGNIYTKCQHKVEIIKAHLKDLAERYPDDNDELHYYFFDDDGVVLNAVNKYLTKTDDFAVIKNPIYIHCYQFSWVHSMRRNEFCLADIIHHSTEKTSAKEIPIGDLLQCAYYAMENIPRSLPLSNNSFFNRIVKISSLVKLSLSNVPSVILPRDSIFPRFRK